MIKKDTIQYSQFVPRAYHEQRERKFYRIRFIFNHLKLSIRSEGEFMKYGPFITTQLELRIKTTFTYSPIQNMFQKQILLSSYQHQINDVSSLR